MIATATASRRRPTLRCTKCGLGPRHVDLDGEPMLLCGECLVDGTYRADKAEAEARFPNYREQWAWLRSERGWYGGWPVPR